MVEHLNLAPNSSPRHTAVLTPALVMNLAAAIACISVMAVTTGMSWTLLSLVLNSKGCSSFWIGVNAAAQSLGIIAAGFATPAILSRGGFFPSCVGAIAISCILFLLFPILDNFVAWMALRLVLGGCGSLLFIAGESWLLHAAPENYRGRIIGVLGLFWGGSFTSGPLLVSLAGTQGFAPYVLGATAAGLAGIPVLIEAKTVTVPVNQSSGAEWLKLLRRHPTPLLALALLGVVDASMDSLLPIYGTGNGVPQESAALFVAVAVAGISLIQPLTGWAVDKCNNWTLIRILPLAGCLFTIVFGLLRTSDLQWPVLFLIGCIDGSLWAVSFAIAGSVFSMEELTKVNSLRTILFGAAAMIGPMITGYAMDIHGNSGFIGTLALAWLIYAGVTLVDAKKS
jgi:MFS family permease